MPVELQPFDYAGCDRGQHFEGVYKYVYPLVLPILLNDWPDPC